MPFKNQGLFVRHFVRVYANRMDDNPWSEATIHYNSTPSVGGAWGSSGPFGANVWVEVDVTACITGNGTYSLALTTAKQPRHPG